MIVSAKSEGNGMFSVTLPRFTPERYDEKAAAGRMNGFFEKMAKAMKKYAAGEKDAKVRAYTVEYSADEDPDGVLTVTVSIRGRLSAGEGGGVVSVRSKRRIVTVWIDGYLEEMTD